MLPSFMGITLFTRPRQLNDMEAPVRHADRLRQFEQANGPAVDHILRQQGAALLQTAAPAFRSGILMTAQGDMVGVEPGDPATLNARALALLADDGLSQPGIVVKTSSPKGEHERLPNPTLAVTDGSVTVKFHPWSIEQIVASEQADT